jgi:hypothetical protein
MVLKRSLGKSENSVKRQKTGPKSLQSTPRQQKSSETHEESNHKENESDDINDASVSDLDEENKDLAHGKGKKPLCRMSQKGKFGMIYPLQWLHTEMILTD